MGWLEQIGPEVSTGTDAVVVVDFSSRVTAVSTIIAASRIVIEIITISISNPRNGSITVKAVRALTLVVVVMTCGVRQSPPS